MEYVEYQPSAKHAITGAEIGKDCTAFKDAGRILDEDIVVLDFDTVPKGTLSKMIETFGIHTETVWTDRGAHLYFKRPRGFKSARGTNMLGIATEYKHTGNTTSICIKRNGIKREVENEGILQPLPDFLMPSNRLKSLAGMDENEGRNNNIYQLKKVTQGHRKQEAILKFVNQYVFATPLPEAEMATILRPEKITAEKDGEHAVATYMIRKHRIVKYDGSLYYKEGERYNTDDEALKALIFDIVGEKRTNYVDEVFKQIQYRAPVQESKALDIRFKNGILRDGVFLAVLSEEFTPFYINVNYNPNRKPVKAVDDYVDFLTGGDKTKILLLMEILGHSLITSAEKKRALARFFIFVGGGGNGKGTLLQVIESILNSENCTALSVEQLTDERYFHSIKGKLANLGDDMHDSVIDNKKMKVLKNISTCDIMAARELYKKSISIQPTITMYFTSNHMIRSYEKGDSYSRRVMWINMDQQPAEIDPFLISKLTTPEALEYWIALIIEGYIRLCANNKFTKCEEVEKFNQEYHENNNGCLSYVVDSNREDFIGISPKTVQDNFEVWAEENGVKASSRVLSETICNVHNLKKTQKRIDGGKRAWVYIEADTPIEQKKTG